MTALALREPSPSDWERWEQRLLNGEDPSAAAQAEGQTCSSFRRQDEARQRALLAISREARADEADRRLDMWATDFEASDQVKLYWHRYHANRAGRVSEKVEVTGREGGPIQVEDRSASLADVARVLEAAGALAAIHGGGTVGGEVAGPRQLLPVPPDS